MPDAKNRLVGYQMPRSNRYVIRIVIATVLMTLAILAILPFTQALSGDPRDRTIRSVDIANLPPPEPPPPEPPPPPELENEAQPLSLSQLESSLNPGLGSALYEALSSTSFQVAPDAVAEMQIFEIRDLDRQPRVLKMPPMRYPPKLQSTRTEGVVRVQIIIDETGRTSVEKIVDATNREFIPAAREWVTGLVFESPMKDGKAVRARYILPVRYELPD